MFDVASWWDSGRCHSVLLGAVWNPRQGDGFPTQTHHYTSKQVLNLVNKEKWWFNEKGYNSNSDITSVWNQSKFSPNDFKNQDPICHFPLEKQSPSKKSHFLKKKKASSRY